MIDLDALVPLPEPGIDTANHAHVRVVGYTAAQMTAFRLKVAQEVAKRCFAIAEGTMDCGPDNGCCPTFWNESLERCASAIAAEFGLEKL